MKAKEFLKTVWSRYTSLGLCAMGIYNIVLLVLYFKHWIKAMPANMTLAAVDAALILGFTLLGVIVEAVRHARSRKSRPLGSTDVEGKEKTLR